jgi:hypothetical protein
MLKDIPTGSTFTMRLVEPTKSGFQGIAPRAGPKGTAKKGGYGSGKETLRFKANGNASIEDEVSWQTLELRKNSPPFSSPSAKEHFKSHFVCTKVCQELILKICCPSLSCIKG